MADLTTLEKQILEKLFKIDGYVLDFSNRTFQDFFKTELGIEIYSKKYFFNGDSKAKILRAFWEVENNKIVSLSIDKLLEYVENQILLGNYSEKEYSKSQIEAVKKIIRRLNGENINVLEKSEEKLDEEDEFLKKEFEEIGLEKLGLDTTITNLLQDRLLEIKKNLNSKNPLSVIFLSGSVLEGILFGIANKNIKDFNNASSSPKDKDGKVKKFQDWTLNDYINTAKDVGYINEDVKKFSHTLKDFRNYIHPYQQMYTNFSPSQKTAELCFKVLVLAIYQINDKK